MLGSGLHLRKLDADEKQAVPRYLVPGSGRGLAEATLISEAGLYKLIAKSDKPKAEAFDRWVRHEVLPAISKTGGYLLNEEAHDTVKNDLCCHARKLRILEFSVQRFEHLPSKGSFVRVVRH